MNTAIKVGNDITKDSAENLKQIIETIFKVGADTRMGQKTIIAALELVGKVVVVGDISISDTHIKGDTVINAHDAA